MTEMLDKCTSVLRGTLHHHGVELHPEDVRGLAMDVLTTLLQPTEDMVVAGLETSSRYGKPAMRNIFTNMLRSAMGAR